MHEFFTFLGINYSASMFCKIVLIINFIIMVLFTLFYLSQNVFLILGLFFKNKRYKSIDKLNRFGYIICAHNEENVIEGLIDSIKKQDYPAELIHIFVVCDNCSDQTKNIVTNLGCNVIERFNTEKIGKGYALDYGIKDILNNYSDLNIDAFLIFDADNLLSKDYTSKMNDAYNSGLKVCTSFRGSKNFAYNTCTATAAMTFLRECQIVHKGRSLLNIGTYVSGTGFYVAYEILKENNGWPYQSLIEDIEFSCDCAIKNIKIGYQSEAIFYDEQPTTLKDTIKQRLRWCRGNHQCFLKYSLKLIKGLFKKGAITRYEMLIHTTPMPALLFIWTFVFSILLGINAKVYNLSFNEFLNSGIVSVLYYFIFAIGLSFIHGIVALFKSRKKMKCNFFKQILYIILFPFYMMLLLIISVIALFKKVRWEKIQHKCVKTIDEM